MDTGRTPLAAGPRARTTIRPASLGWSILASVAILVVACGGSAPPVDQASPASGSAPPVSTLQSPAAAGASPTSDLTIGVVTGVGLVHDKGMNEDTLVGATDGARAIGAPDPIVVLPASPDDVEGLLRAFVDQDFDVVVAAGSALQAATTKVAKANPNVWFIGVDQGGCVTAAGDLASPPAECPTDGDPASPKYVAISYAEDQAGYLAGMVAASASKTGTIGAIGRDPSCASCIRSMQGYALGARAVDPNIRLRIGWTSEASGGNGGGSVGSRAFADGFIARNTGIDVVFQAADSIDDGVIDAACAAGVSAIGADFDHSLADPGSRTCILTSAETRIATSVAETIAAIDSGTATGGPNRFDAADHGVGLAPFYDAASRLPADMQSRVDTATAEIASGALRTCPPPPDCGRVGIAIGD